MGILSLTNQLPEQDLDLVRKLSLRWMRAAGPHNEWATVAKRCTDFLEGCQWTEEELRTMSEVNRAALTLNRINPLFRLALGYQNNNRTDTTYQPTSDSRSSEQVADVLTNLKKTESDRNDLAFVDSEVYADGLTGGRGFWDARLSFDENDLGEYKIIADDPYTIYIDPDCYHYDLNEGASYIQQSQWVSIDWIAAMYGPAAAMEVESLSSPTFQSTLLSFLGETDISPKRFFGQYADDKAMGNFADVYHTDFIDRQARRVRLLETQYKVMGIKPCFIDLETGDKEPIPDEWLKQENYYKIEAALKHAEALNNPLKIANRPVKRVRWTVTCADILLFDQWSPYESYTKIGFFPYFRRGKTRGMIEDLIDPQREINKKRSVLADILNRNANSGWMYEKDSLDPAQKENIQRYGSSPGVNVEWKRVGQKGEAPRRIEPGGYPQGLDRLEEKATDDLFSISGINESALGQLDRVQSGRAIEARQRQAVLSIQLYQDNFSRSKKIEGKKFLEIVQNHYTEERVFRIIGEDSNLATFAINQRTQTGTDGVSRINDITVGKYSTVVDTIPASATFKQGQFEETMMLIEKFGIVGEMLVQVAPDLLIDMTSLPRKEDWKQALIMARQAIPPAAAMAADGAQGGGAPMPVGAAAQTPEKFSS